MVCYLALGFVMSIMVLDLGEQQIFDLRIQGYNYQDAQELIEVFGQGARQLHLFYMVPLDTVFPLLYGTLLTMILIKLQKKVSHRFRLSEIALVFPWIPVGLDFLENILGVIMIHITLNPQLVAIASVATRLKWYTLGGLVAFILILWVLSLFPKKEST